MLILVVDDEPDHRSLARRVMERGGHTVLTARDASHALEMMADHAVDLVVTDLHMPGEDGLELAERVHEEYPDVVCIVWSSVRDSQGGRVLPKNVMTLDVDSWLEQHAPDLTEPGPDQP